MTVRVDAGILQNGTVVVDVPAQSTGTITAPSVDPRIDRVVIDANTGNVSVITGSEAASPTAPALTEDKILCCQVLLQTSTTSITNFIITDERAWGGVGDGGKLVDDLSPQLGGILDTNGHRVDFSKGADIASASTLLLGSDGNYFDVTGTNTVSGINSVGIGSVIKLHFDDVLILEHDPDFLVLPGGIDITTQAGDEVEFVEYAPGDKWRCTNYERADGKPISGNALQDDLSPQLGGILDTNGHRVDFSKGADIASASTLLLGSDGNYFDVTGTITISSIGAVGVGTVITLHFDYSLLLSHNAVSFILPSGADVLTNTGDQAEFIEYATGLWRCTNYQRADGGPTSGGWVPIERKVFSSISPILQFKNIPTQSYIAFVLVVTKLAVQVINSYTLLQVSPNNGSTYRTSGYDYHMATSRAASVAYLGVASTTGSSIQLATNQWFHPADSFSGMLYMIGMGDASTYTKFFSVGMNSYPSNSYPQSQNITGQAAWFEGHNAFRLLHSPGGSLGFPSGDMTLYGIRR